VGVGDVGAVPGGRGDPGHASSGNDGGRAGRERERDVLCRLGEFERYARVEPGGDGISVGDGPRVELGAGGVHGAGKARADGMRGDGVGVGDVGALPGGAWCSRHQSYIGYLGSAFC
jgi:hypothetical protein